MDRELHQTRDAAEQLRLVPARTLFTSLERTARDVAGSQSKQVLFESEGGDIRLDIHVIETIQGALVQIVRNAVAHGIETVSERRISGKLDSGRVKVKVGRRGGHIVFECSDDGRGIDLDAVRRRAEARGLSPRNAAQLDAEALIRLLLAGGISTSAVITKIAGRGIGLDVVREALEQLGGDIIVRNEPGRGTVFELVVPPSLAAMEMLIVEAAGVVAGIPQDVVQRSERVEAHQIARTQSGMSLRDGQTAIPFLPLATALGGVRPRSGRNWTVVVLTGQGGSAAIGVDRLLGTARIVMRPLPDYAPASTIIAGASLDAEGNPQLVLDPEGLIANILQADTSEVEPDELPLPILIVDDSLTTRMLERSILESAGYTVDLALSGEDALECARRKRYALLLVDVEMPGMDGFTFIERIRSDPALHEIPAILVTSRAATGDRQRGCTVGAQCYVIKSEFDQGELLTMIRRLTGNRHG
jgi:two-component system chemotaxis sensor kinase CheA